jgi:predicted ATPase
LSVSGFRSIRELDALPLDDINVVIGPNGSGKSNFVGVFRLLNELVNGNLQDYVTKRGGADRILHFGSKTTERLKIEVLSDANTYEIGLIPTDDGGLAFEREVVSFLGTAKWITEPNQLETRLRTTKRAGRIPPYVISALEGWRVYHFHDTSENSPLRRRAKTEDNRFLRDDGENLPAFLYLLQQTEPSVFEEIEYQISRIAPFFKGFNLEPERLNDQFIRLVWRHRGTDAYFDAADLSDGTLRFIALMTLLLQPDPPSTIVLDEPELGLHPSALQVLASVMQSISGETQIIFATQSVTLANQFNWPDLIIVDTVEDESQFRRLEEKEVQEWLGEYSLGELWEKNIIGGRPQ